MLADLIIPPSYREAHWAGLQRYLETGEGPVLGSRLELAALHREGFEFPVEITISVAPGEGKQTFKASRVGMIAGCEVTDGKVVRDGEVRLIRDGTVVWAGKIGSLRLKRLSSAPQAELSGTPPPGATRSSPKPVRERSARQASLVTRPTPIT